MNQNTYSTSASPAVGRSRAQTSMWIGSEQGIRMPFAAPQLHGTGVVSALTCTAAANAAQGAFRKDATGDEVFRDPV
jgi:hypothetical protein